MKKIILIILLILFISTPLFAGSNKYDGIWFLGFNMHKDLFGDVNGKLVRQAINHSINKPVIVKIIGENVIPSGVIPPGMLGYDSGYIGYGYNVKDAKKMMKKAGYPQSDKRIKNLTLLHTDGDKTIRIAQLIKLNLIDIGFNVILKQIPYKYEDMWCDELASGKYHMFLMGYKGEESQSDNPYDLLNSLFATKGSANFTYYNNSAVDSLLTFIQSYDSASREVLLTKFKEINSIIMQDPPVVNLFYITTL